MEIQTRAHRSRGEFRVERQSGYKQAKYLMRVQVVDSFAQIGRGHGGFWPDRGYELYRQRLSRSSSNAAYTFIVSRF